MEAQELLPDDLLCFLDEEAIVFDGYTDSIIGYTTDGAAVYDYDIMVEEGMRKNGWSAEESIEWVDYNVVRSLPYTSRSGIPPVIINIIERDT